LAKDEKVTIVYIGSIDEVDVPMPDGTRATVARNEELEVPAAFAARLLEQDINWRAAPASKKKEA
jgi:hypothetical protein